MLILPRCLGRTFRTSITENLLQNVHVYVFLFLSEGNRGHGTANDDRKISDKVATLTRCFAKIQSEKVKVSKLPQALQLRLSTSKLRLSSDLWWTKNTTGFYVKPDG